MLATHLSPEERQEKLVALTREFAGSVTNAEAWREKTKMHQRDWLLDEIKRGQHEESIALLTRMIASASAPSDVMYARGEIYRLRAKDSDQDAAMTDYQAAIAAGSEPPETHRGLGLIYRSRRQTSEAREALERYLKLAPEAPDQMMIKSYLEELTA